MTDRRALALCGLCLAWTAACNAGPAATPPPSGGAYPMPAATPEAGAYPAPGTVVDSGYPAPSTGGVEPGYPAQDAYFVQPTDVVNPVAPADAPQPAPGLATVSGLLFSYTSARVLPGTSFYLAPANGPNAAGVPELLGSPDPAKGHVIGATDDQGRLTLTDIPPGKYYLLVWAPLNWIFAQVSQSNSTPRLIELAPDQAQPLGVIYLSWP